jgi:hypothetical protein
MSEMACLFDAQERTSLNEGDTSEERHQETLRGLFDYLVGAGDADGRPDLRLEVSRSVRRRLRRLIVSTVLLLRAPLGNPQEPVSRRTLPPLRIDIHCGLL